MLLKRDLLEEIKAGKIEFRNDAGGIVHAVVGKISFDLEKLVENIEAFMHHIQNIKPAAVRGQYVKSVIIKVTMSPADRAVASKVNDPSAFKVSPAGEAPEMAAVKGFPSRSLSLDRTPGAATARIEPAVAS